MQGIVTNWLQTGMMRLSTMAIMPSTNPALLNLLFLSRIRCIVAGAATRRPWGHHITSHVEAVNGTAVSVA